MNTNSNFIFKKYYILIPVLINSISYFFLTKTFYYIFCIVTLIYLISIFFEKSHSPNLKSPIMDYILSIIFLCLILLTKISFRFLFIPLLELLVIRIIRCNLIYNNIDKNINKKEILKNTLTNKEIIDNPNNLAIKELKDEIHQVKTIISTKEMDSKTMVKDENLDNDIYLLKTQMQQLLVGLNITTDIKKQLD